MNIEQLKKRANRRNKKLRLPDFNRNVYVEHEDGSMFVLPSALKETFGRCTIVYTEHNFPLIFYTEDLRKCKYIKKHPWNAKGREEFVKNLK